MFSTLHVVEVRIMRRLFYGLLAVFLFVPMSLSPALAAQEATPQAESAFADLGLPELDITATVDGFEGFPDQLDAGRYLVRVTADAELESGGGFELIQPSGMTAAEFLEMAGPPSDEAGAAAVDATPVGELIASPEAVGEEEMGGPPPELFDAAWAGGVFAEGGTTVEVVLDITPGEWIVSFEGEFDPIVFEATGEMPADLPEPEAQATLTMGEYFIEVSEGELTSGSYVVRVDNIGAQPHFVAWVQGPEGLTEEQLEVVLQEETEAEMTGTPVVYSDFNPDEDIEAFIVFSGTQSTGTSQWIQVSDVQAGTHVLICFFPDLGDGMPHAVHGMYTIVEIGE
jgi:hypothetical protein